MNPSFPGAVPEIPVRSLGQALDYYQHQLGFSRDWEDEGLGLAGISRGNCRMFLATEAFRQGYRNVGPILIWLNLDSNDEVDALHRAWTASGATLLGFPESKPWGLHEFVATDPDGNLFRVFHDFATPERERNG